jgi:hypothetical protein
MEPHLDTEREAAGRAAYGFEGAFSVSGNKGASSGETINAMMHQVCEDLSITAEQLRMELKEGGDLLDLQSGALAPQALRLTAKTLALMRYAARE